MTSAAHAAPPPVAAADRLCVRFGPLWALDRVSFALPAGSITGLVGPNGSGKTTLIKVLATLLAPTTGRVLVGGVDAARRPEKVRAMIGFLPDFPGLYQDMKVVEYLRFFADAYGLDGARTRAFVDEALAVSGLGPRRDSFIEELSRGMRAKLSFARALAGDPRLMLLDEPLANLDPVARGEMLSIIGGMRSAGRCVLVSSHLLSELERLCDHVLFLSEGRIVAEPGAGEAQGPLYLVRLAAAPDGADAGAALRGLAGVADVREAQGDAAARLLRLAAGADPAAVLRGAVAAGLPVVEWRPVALSLEERLVRAVKGGGS